MDYAMQLQQQEEEQKLKDTQMDNMLMCAVRNHAIQGSDLFVADACGHVFCKNCAADHLRKTYAQIQKGTCPEHTCGQLLQEIEVKDILGQETYDTLQNVMVKNFMGPDA